VNPREAAVLAVMRRHVFANTPAVIARVIDLAGPPDWCRLDNDAPPKWVPRQIRDRVKKVLDGLVKSGQVVKDTNSHRRATYKVRE